VVARVCVECGGEVWIVLVKRFERCREEEGDVRCVLSSFQSQTIHSRPLVNLSYSSIAQSSRSIVAQQIASNSVKSKRGNFVNS
jgi:hypothetical protein